MFPFETWLAKAHHHRLSSGRPLVSLCYAQSLDGSLTDRRGKPLALSGPESNRITHRLRAQHTAILLGIGAVLADDPELTVRLVDGPDPLPIILDSNLRIPLNARLLREERIAPRPWIVASTQVDEAKSLVFEATGARVIQMSSSTTGEIDLPALLDCLGDMGIDSLMVEGGAQVITSFLSQSLADFAVITLAPVLIGGWNVIVPPGLAELARGKGYPRLCEKGIDRFGEDFLIWGKIR